MAPLPKDFVRPLAEAENRFLEVLLSGFTLSRQVGSAGVQLHVAFDGSTSSAWNRDGRNAVRKFNAAFLGLKQYQDSLDAILLGGKAGTFTPQDSSFLWRWASAGALPVINYRGGTYYCLFFRDVFPIGWNIANGACDTRNELLDPLQALEREVGEELIVASKERGIRYLLKPGDDSVLDRAEFTNFRRLWQKQFPQVDLLNCKVEGLALNWESGPDTATVQSDKHSHTITDCFVNINTMDFGIELDRIARITVENDVILCDGEATSDRILNRPVGLFDVGTLQNALQTSKAFEPDIFFHCGERKEGNELKALLEGALAMDVEEWRTPEEKAAYKQFLREDSLPDLCPVTRSIILRQCTRAKREEIELNHRSRSTCGKIRSFDVFISFGSPDLEYARQIFQFVRDELGFSPFFAPDILPTYSGFWSKSIDDALSSAAWFIAVATAPEHLERPEVNYEISTYRELHGCDKNHRFIPVISGFTHSLLPTPLRKYQILTWNQEGGLSDVLGLLRARLSQHEP